MACGYGWVSFHLQGAKMSLKVSVGGAGWWDLDCKGTRASAASLITIHTINSCSSGLSSQNQGLNFTAPSTTLIIIHLNFRVLRLSAQWKSFLREIDHTQKSTRIEKRRSWKMAKDSNTWKELRFWSVEIYFTL